MGGLSGRLEQKCSKLLGGKIGEVPQFFWDNTEVTFWIAKGQKAL